MNILLVINPISGDKNKTDLLKKVKNSIPKQFRLSIYKTTGDNDKTELKKRMEAEDFNRILVAGGDGTIKLVAEACLEKNIEIGILPVGSANGLANDLGLPLEPEAYIPIALGNKTREIDIVSINDHFGLHISDFGLNAELIKEYSKGKIRGVFGYALNSIPTLFQSEGPYQFTIETDKETINRTAIMLAIANSKKFGTGAVVNPNGEIDDGIFEILIFKKLDLLEIFKTLQEGTTLSEDFVEIIPAKKVIIKTKKAIDFQIDGEYCEAITEVNAYIHPKQLKVLVG